MNMKNGAGLGLAIHWLRQALISAYEDNSALRLVRTCRQSLKCTVELESFRREIRRSFNKCLSDKELYREGRRNYRKKVRKVSNNVWRTFCSSIKDLPRSARLHKALSRDHKIKLVSLVAPSDRRRQPEGENLELLLNTHSPNSEVTQELAAPAAVLLVRRCDWMLATRVATYRRIDWAIDSFAPYKMQGCIAYYRPCCKRNGRLSPYT